MGRPSWLERASQRLFRWMLTLRADLAVAAILGIMGLVVAAELLVDSPIVPYTYVIPIVLAATRFRATTAILFALAAGSLAAAIPVAAHGIEEPLADTVTRGLVFVLVGLLVRAMLPATRANLLEEMERSRFGTTISEALAAGQMSLVYQPIISVATGRATGVEALLRWGHPTKGNVPPGTFIPLATQSDTIHEITEWVIDRAAEQLAEWKGLVARMVDFQVAVNVTGLDMHQGLAPMISEALARHDVPAGRLSLEIGETTLALGGATTDRALDALGQANVGVAIADLGTGYANWRALRDRAVRRVKIDRSFVAGCVNSIEDQATIERLVQLAHELELDVVAEGVENAEQFEVLTAAGVDHVQGWFFGRPVRPVEVEERIWSEQMDTRTGGVRRRDTEPSGDGTVSAAPAA